MNNQLQNICKVGQGAACCRYIVAGGSGIVCAKLTPMKEMIDTRVALGRFVAQGDNCPGLDEEIDLTKHIPNEQIPKETSSN